MMASLAELTDNPFVQNTIDSVALRDATDLPKTRIIVRPEFVKENEPVKQDDSKLQNIIDKLFGLNGQERYQLWPEFTNRAFGSDLEIYKDGEKPANGLIDLAQQAHLLPSNKYNVFKDLSTFVKDPLTGVANDIRSVRRLAKGFADSIVSGVTAPHDAIQGKIPAYQIDENGNVRPSDEIIHRAMDVAGLAGSGGLAGAGSEAGVALGSAPFLRPALKYGEKLYKGKPGQQHMDVIPADLYPTFQKQAMSGEDISNFNFGFLNHKGQFLSREDALKYAIDNGLVDPHSAQYGALTSTLMSDTAKPGAALAAVANTNKPFYSAVENAVAAAKQPKADAQQWLSFLKNQPGVKQEELAHLGLDKLSGSISKDDLLKAVQEGQPQIKEVTKLARSNINKDNLTAEKTNDGYWEVKNNGEFLTNILEPSFTRDQALNEAVSRVKDGKIMSYRNDTTKYSKYQLPGGENYREMLLTLPEKKFAKDDPRVMEEAKLAYKEKDIPRLTDSQWDMLRARAARRNGDVLEAPYVSSHWDEPNVLAHIRMNDRTIDGKKTLHLEEIQSDWHQEGRKKGYKDNSKINSLQEEVDNINKNFQPLKELPEGYELIKDGDKWGVIPPGQIHARPFAGQWSNKDLAIKSALDKINETDLIKSRDEIQSKLIEAKSGIPDAPFKKTWDELALKKAITEAVKNGYDQISWTPGEAQAARYDLSKQVDSIKYLKNDDGTYNIVPFKNDRPVHSVEAENIKPEKLSDIVGKEVAEKITNGHGEREKGASDIRVLSGQDLKVGGQGMKAFYDKMLVDKMNALIKKYGGKVEQKDLASGKRKTLDEISNDLGFGGWHSNLTETQKSKIMSVFDEQKPQREGKTKVHVLKITPELREQVLKKGLPLFSAGVPVFTPVPHNPFKDNYPLPNDKNTIRPEDVQSYRTYGDNNGKTQEKL